MTFRQAMIEALNQGNKKAKADKLASSDNRHPRLWKALQNIVVHHYERDTGQTVGAGFDFSTIIQWIIENLPAILKLLLLLFGI